MIDNAHRRFLCRCEDIDEVEVREAIEMGYDDLEGLRRFTTVATGPCQGRQCLAECIRLLADHHGVDEGEIGLMTLRPPVVPIPLGLLAGLPDDMVEGLLDGEEAERVRAARVARDSDDSVKTGRATPTSLGRQEAEDDA